MVMTEGRGGARTLARGCGYGTGIRYWYR
ncbi:hypothetical protein A2U01_0093142, partial [Trifolium medium]|nr:hypothetical protein [Trifolium medium]